MNPETAPESKSDPVAAAPQAPPFDVLLAQSRDLTCESLAKAFAAMLDKVDDSLTALIDESRDQAAQKLYRETRDKVLGQRESLEKQFRIRYQAEFQKRSNRVRKIGGSFSDLDLSALELELVGEDDLNESIRFKDMANRLRQYCEEELLALDQRVGVLLGDASLQEEDNPFTPQAICDAYKQTCRQFDSNVEVRMILLKLFDDHVLDDIRAVYKAVNALLVQNSILPKIRRAPRKERSKPPKPGEATAETPAAAGEQDLFSMLQGLIVSNLNAMVQGGALPGMPAPSAPTVAAAIPGFPPIMVSGGTGPGVAGQPVLPGQQILPGFPPIMGSGGAVPGVAGQPILQGPELLGSLTRIQHGDANAVPGIALPAAALSGEPVTANVLRELKSSGLGNGMNQLDMMTLDIVAMLFDQLFDDPKIPVAVKGLIGRLQIPMLKVAIADKTLFSRKNHPARQLLDVLGEMSTRLPADFAPSSALFGQMQAIIADLLEGFEENIEVFDAAREKIQGLIVEGDQRAEEESRAAAIQVEQKESLALAKTVAQAEIKVRIRFGKLPREVIEFLVRQWIKVLITVQATGGEENEAWRHALETMDLLIWSIEPKNAPEERRELGRKVPDLLRRLTQGLKLAGVEEAERLRFFAELRKIHSDILDRATRPKPAAAPEAGVPTQPAQPEVTHPAEAAAPPAPSEVVTPAPSEALQLAKPEAAPAAEAPTAPQPTAQPEPAPAVLQESSILMQPLPSLDLPEERTIPLEALSASVPAPALPEAAAPKLEAPVLKFEAPETKAEAPEPKSEEPEFTPAITVNNPFGGGEVQVDDLDFTVQPESGKKKIAGGAEAAELAGLKPGVWVRIRAKGDKDPGQVAKLSFVSPLKTRYLFVDRQGKTVLECPAIEMAARMRDGRVVIESQPQQDAPLFDRIMGGVVGKLRGPAAPLPAGKSAAKVVK